MITISRNGLNFSKTFWVLSDSTKCLKLRTDINECVSVIYEKIFENDNSNGKRKVYIESKGKKIFGFVFLNGLDSQMAVKAIIKAIYVSNNKSDIGTRGEEYG